MSDLSLVKFLTESAAELLDGVPSDGMMALARRAEAEELLNLGLRILHRNEGDNIAMIQEAA